MNNISIRELSENIAKDFELSVKERTDKILELDANQYTNLGIESSKSERNKVKADSKFLYKQIKGFNEIDGNLLLNHLD
jgi:hypothetical protein